MAVIEQISTFLIVLVVFVLLLYGSYYCAKRVGGTSLRGGRSRYMKVVDRIVIGQDRDLSIICIGNRYYLIGSSAGGINMLTEIEAENLVESEIPQGPLSGTLTFKEIMKKITKDKEEKHGE